MEANDDNNLDRLAAIRTCIIREKNIITRTRTRIVYILYEQLSNEQLKMEMADAAVS